MSAGDRHAVWEDETFLEIMEVMVAQHHECT